MDLFGDRAMPYLIAAIYAVYLPVFLLVSLFLRQRRRSRTVR